jgi:alpha-beta hydrolase superfamily lysophospholipase
MADPAAAAPAPLLAWSPDEALAGFERATLRFPDDYEGPVVATLVRRRPAGAPARRAVLYVHGYIDYFFQAHLAEAFLERGWAFYAIDLRKHGRSLLPAQRPNFCRDVREYDADLTAAIDVVTREEDDPFLLLLGHSTGGLLAALYAAAGERRGRIDALALNSPFLAFAVSAPERGALAAVGALGSVFPAFAVPGGLTPAYGESLHRDHHGEWDFDPRWKPVRPFPLYAGWLRAIRAAHRRLRGGPRIGVPVLLMHSDRSVRRRRWHESLMTADGVLDVADMRRLGPTLGPRVTLAEIGGGMHDLTLSRRDVREHAAGRLFAWLEPLAAGR